MLMHIGEVLRNSVEINELNPKKENASDSYILLGAAQGKEKRYVVFAVVNRFTNDIESVDVLYSMNIKEESAVSKTRASGNALQSLTDSTISISELLEIVKDKHPEILSADVLAHYDLSRGNSELERGLKFSLKDTTELKAENKKLIEDNDKQRRYIRELESAVGLNKKELDERAIRRLSGQILREYSSVYDKVVWSLMLKVTLKSDILFLCNF